MENKNATTTFQFNYNNYIVSGIWRGQVFNISIFNNLIFCFPQGDLAKGFVAGLKKPATLEGEDNDSGTEWEYQVECMIAFNLNKIIKEIPANLMKRKLYCDLIMKMADDHSKEYNDSNSLY